MIEAEIEIREVGSAQTPWEISLDLRPLGGLAKPKRVHVRRLVDKDLDRIPSLPRQVRYWSRLTRYFVSRYLPNSELSFQVSLRQAQEIGALIRQHFLGHEEFVPWMKYVTDPSHAGQIRFALIIDTNDPDLWRIPFELAFDSPRFVFKQPRRPAVHVGRELTPLPRIRVQPRDRLLMVTAHDDRETEPTQSALAEHARGIMAAAERIGLQVQWLENATPERLKEALTGSAHVDLLYAVCHGVENAELRGQLSLRSNSGSGNEPVSGDELAQWSREQAERGHELKAAILCACSTASAADKDGTSGMAQWMLQGGSAQATIGFRAPVGVTWALQFMEKLFARLGEGALIEDAFTEVRAESKNDDPQWALPLFFTRLLDDSVPSQRYASRRLHALPAMGFESALQMIPSLLPRRPRSYFTGREDEMAQLTAWLEAPGQVVLRAVAGEGGVGKTELAAVIAHQVHEERKWPVLFLERPDKFPLTAALTMLDAVAPDIRPNPESPLEDLTLLLREKMRPHRGLLIFDDVQDARAVDPLLPGGHWNVLVTTRVHGAFADAEEIPVKPLAPADAVKLFSRVAWGQDAPPEGERAATEALVEMLGCLPLALEEAGGTVRQEVQSVAEYVEQIQARIGKGASDLQRVEAVLTRSLKHLGPDVDAVSQALAVLPPVGASLRMVARTLDKSEPWTARHLERAGLHHLSWFDPERGRYRLHPLMREAMRVRAKTDVNGWRTLHGGVGAALRDMAWWVREPMKRSVDEALIRWREVADVFEALDMSAWNAQTPGANDVAEAIAVVDAFRQFTSPVATRLAAINAAATLATHEATQAMVVHARGDLRRFKGDFDGALADYDQALELFKFVDERVGKANVLEARGVLRLRKADLDGALSDYEQALELYKLVGASLGQANVLQSRGDLRRRKADLDGALSDFKQALELYKLVDDPLGQANVLRARGNLERERAEFAAALHHYRAAYHLYTTVSDNLGVSNVLAEIAATHLFLNQLADARAAAEEALPLARKAHNSYALTVLQAIVDALEKL